MIQVYYTYCSLVAVDCKVTDRHSDALPLYVNPSEEGVTLVGSSVLEDLHLHLHLLIDNAFASSRYKNRKTFCATW